MSDEKKVVKTVKAVKVKKVTAKVAEPKVKELTPDLFEAPARENAGQDVSLAAAKPAPAETALAAAKEPAEKTVEKTPFWKKWWFWLIVAGLALAVFALANGGGAGNSDSTSPTSATTAANGVQELTTTTESGNGGGILNVEVTLPPTFFEGQTKEQIEAEAKDAGYSNCVVHEDGSVTYTMTKLKQAQILKEFKAQIDTTIGEMLAGGTDAPQSYKNITYDKDVTKFDVRVDRAAFESSAMDSMYGLALHLLGGYYQMFDGVPEAQVDVTVNFLDDSNGQVFQTTTYQQAMQNLNSAMF